MLTYNFENIGSDTLYEYLYKCIKNDIIQGKIKSGEKLPSKRALAKNLAISVITVENAYGQLAAEGYIYSVPKSGFYVADLRDDRMKSESVLSENRIYSNKINLTGGKNAYIADFTSNQTEQSAFPFSIWTKTMRAVMNDYQTELMLNPPCGGVMELRQSIAEYLKAFRNMTVRPEQIIIGAGTEYLSSLLIQLLGKELKYSVENPGYHKIAKIYRSMGASYEYIEIEEDGPKVEELEQFGSDFEIKWGIGLDPELGNKVKVTILATGFGIENVDGMNNHMRQLAQEEDEKQVEINIKNAIRRNHYYGDDKGGLITKRRPHIFRFSADDLDNEEVILTVETTPTYKRTLQQLNELRRRIVDEKEAPKPNNDNDSVAGTISFA